MNFFSFSCQQPYIEYSISVSSIYPYLSFISFFNTLLSSSLHLHLSSPFFSSFVYCNFENPSICLFSFFVAIPIPSLHDHDHTYVQRTWTDFLFVRFHEQRTRILDGSSPSSSSFNFFLFCISVIIFQTIIDGCVVLYTSTVDFI